LVFGPKVLTPATGSRALFANDEVVVHENAAGLCGLDDRLHHLDVGM